MSTDRTVGDVQPSVARGHDGLTWRERRATRKRADAIKALFFMTCEKHGKDVPIHPYDDGCFYCVEEVTP